MMNSSKHSKNIKPLEEIIKKYAAHLTKEDQLFCKEIVLWSLSSKNKLDKSEIDNIYKFDSSEKGLFI